MIEGFYEKLPGAACLIKLPVFSCVAGMNVAMLSLWDAFVSEGKEPTSFEALSRLVRDNPRLVSGKASDKQFPENF